MTPSVSLDSHLVRLATPPSASDQTSAVPCACDACLALLADDVERALGLCDTCEKQRRRALEPETPETPESPEPPERDDVATLLARGCMAAYGRILLPARTLAARHAAPSAVGPPNTALAEPPPPPVTIATLPDDVLIAILTLAAARSSSPHTCAAAVTRACTRWRGLGPRIWRALCLSPPNSRVVRQLLSPSATAISSVEQTDWHGLHRFLALTLHWRVQPFASMRERRLGARVLRIRLGGAPIPGCTSWLLRSSDQACRQGAAWCSGSRLLDSHSREEPFWARVCEESARHALLLGVVNMRSHLFDSWSKPRLNASGPPSHGLHSESGPERCPYCRNTPFEKVESLEGLQHLRAKSRLVLPPNNPWQPTSSLVTGETGATTGGSSSQSSYSPWLYPTTLHHFKRYHFVGNGRQYTLLRAFMCEYGHVVLLYNAAGPRSPGPPIAPSALLSDGGVGLAKPETFWGECFSTDQVRDAAATSDDDAWSATDSEGSDSEASESDGSESAEDSGGDSEDESFALGSEGTDYDEDNDYYDSDEEYDSMEEYGYEEEYFGNWGMYVDSDDNSDTSVVSRPVRHAVNAVKIRKRQRRVTTGIAAASSTGAATSIGESSNRAADVHFAY